MKQEWRDEAERYIRLHNSRCMSDNDVYIYGADKPTVIELMIGFAGKKIMELMQEEQKKIIGGWK